MKTSSDDEIARNFWTRVDELRGKMQLQELADKCGISFTTLRNQKSGKTLQLPKLIQSLLIAKALNTSVEFLVFGNESETTHYTRGVIEIADACMTATEEQLSVVRFALQLNSKVKNFVQSV